MTEARRRRPAGRVAVGVVASLTALMALVNLVSAVRPAMTERLAALDRWLPLEILHGSRLATALAGFALLLLSRGLGRRKQVAWGLTLAVLGISIAGHLLKGLDWEEATFGLVVVTLLLITRDEFHALSDGPSIRRAIGTVVAALLFAILYGTTGFFLLDRHFQVNFNFIPAVMQSIRMFVAFDDPGLIPETTFARWFVDSIYLIGAGSLGLALLLLFRPVVLRAPATPAERRRAAKIVETHGRTSVARFTLLDDKSYLFTPGGSVVSFATRGGIALALGDPIGPPADAAAAIAAFREYAARHDWQVAFYPVGPEFLDVYRAAGFEALDIGREAIVDPAAITLEGKAGAPLRTARNRLARMGHVAAVIPPPLDDRLIHDLAEVSDEWLTERKTREMRFSLGRFDAEYVRESTVGVVRDSGGGIAAFANLLPEYTRPEVVIDLMRRRTEVEPGTMEVLFLALFEWARESGIEGVSLGLTPLAGVGEAPGDPTVEKALRYASDRLHRFYNFRGLHEFKAKFQPRWEPRWLIHPGVRRLPAVMTALVTATLADRPW